MSFRLARPCVVALAMALFFLVWGTKLAVIDRFGSDLPNWDQWDAEGAQVFLPYFQHRLGFFDFFIPHNEHRVACTRALALGLLVLNGQWDTRLECVVNAALHSALALAIFLYGRTLINRRWHGVWFASVAALTAPPIAWQNVLGGFHSQQYFLLWFSLAALAWLLTAPPWSWRWWGGLVCAALALFSMGSGLLAAGVTAGVLAVGGRPREVWRRHGVTMAVCLLVFAAGWALRVEVNQHATLRAHSLAAFGLTLWRSLQWPAVFFAPLAILLWMPWAWLGRQIWRQRDQGDPRLRVIFAAGLWVILQFAATAYTRGAGGPWPASRYLDTVALGVLINALAVLVALSSDAFPGWRTGGRTTVAAAWLGIVVVGGWQHVAEVCQTELPAVGAEMARRDVNTRAYLATGDDHHLDHDIPYPGKDGLIERLSHPEIRAILPVSIRPPVALVGQAEPADSFVAQAVAPATQPLEYVPFWGSYIAGGPTAQGVWRSAPLSAGPHAGYWKIEVAGDLGRRPGLSLQLVPNQAEAPSTVIAPVPASPGGWRTLYVPAPRQAVRLVARDASSFGWFGFSAPVEMAALSYWAMRLTALGPVIAIFSGAIAVLLAALFHWLPAPDR
jgi:hypothetical protein